MQMSAEERLNKLKILTLNMENKENELEQMKKQRSLLILGFDDVSSTGENIDESGNLSSSNFVNENHTPQAESMPFIYKKLKLVNRRNRQNQLNGNDRVSHSRGNGTNESFYESGKLSFSNRVFEDHAPQPESIPSIYKKLKLVNRRKDQLNRNDRVSHSRYDNSGNGTNDSFYESGKLSFSNHVFEDHAPQSKSTSFNHAPKQKTMQSDVTQVKAENRTNGQDQLEVNDLVSHQLEVNDRVSHQLEVNDRVSLNHHNNSEISTNESFDESDSINENRQAESTSPTNIRNVLNRVESSSPINVRNRLKRLNPKSKKSPRKINIKKENEAAKNERRKQSMEWRTGKFCWIKFTPNSKYLPGFTLPKSNGIALARSITLKGTISLYKFLYHEAYTEISEKFKDIRYKRALYKFNVDNKHGEMCE